MSYFINPSGGFLGVNANVTGSSGIYILGNTLITGNLTLSSNATLSNLNASNLTASNISLSNTTVSGNLSVLSYLNISSNLMINNCSISNLIVTGNANISSTLINYSNVNASKITSSNIYVSSFVKQTGNILVPVGSILCWSYSTVPNGYLFCNGASIKVANYTSLYNVIQYTYGGSGSDFSIPNLTNYIPYGVSTYSLNQKSSTNSVTLSAANLPSHTHALTVTQGSHYHTASHTHTFYASYNTSGIHLQNNHTVVQNLNSSSGTAVSGATTSASDTSQSASGSVVTGTVETYGQSSPNSINIVNPYYALYFIIKY
jgi:microcystin-dependent protein